MSKRILVTGGAGFIGSHLVDGLLHAGNEVVVLDNLSSTGSSHDVHANAEFIEGDVRDNSCLKSVFETGIDVVFHVAGQASIRRSFDNPAVDLEVNTVGTLNILNHCVKYCVSRLLFASSMTIYGTPSQIPTPESAFPDPRSYYAVSKYAAERSVHITAQHPNLDCPLNVTSFRMFNVYGPRQSLTNSYQGVFAIFMGNMLRGEPIRIHSDGEQSRDFVYISDVVRAWISAMDRAETYGQVINLGTGTPTTVNRLCDVVLDYFGKTRADYPVIHHPAQPGDIRVSCADITKAQALFGWSPQVAITDGLRETLHWAEMVYKTAQ